MSDTFKNVTATLQKCRNFIDAEFLSLWTKFYRSMTGVPCKVIKQSLPLVHQCEALDADSLKTTNIHLAQQVHSLK